MSCKSAKHYWLFAQTFIANTSTADMPISHKITESGSRPKMASVKRTVASTKLTRNVNLILTLLIVG